MSMKSTIFACICLSLLVINPARAVIINGIDYQISYTNWLSNDSETANYQFAIGHDEMSNQFNYLLTVDPWNAEALGLFIDFGDTDLPGNIGLTNVVPVNEVSLIATDTTSDSCGTGCNLNGLSPPVTDPDGEWETVYRLGSQGFDSIQTFTWTTDDFGLGLDDFGLVAIRSQVLCSGNDLLPSDNESCNGSDKSYSATQGVDPFITPIPEPGYVFFLGLGLIGTGLARRKNLAV